MAPIRRKVRILSAFAKIFPLGYSHVSEPISRVTAPQTALAVPDSLYAMLQILPEMVLTVNALLILIQPPFKTVPFPLFDVTGLMEIDPPVTPIVLCSPEIKAGTMLHCVGAN